MVGVLKNGKQIAEAPDAALIHGKGGGTALLPEPLQGVGIGLVLDSAIAGRALTPGVLYFKQVVTFDATKIATNSITGYPRTASYASKLICPFFHLTL